MPINGWGGVTVTVPLKLPLRVMVRVAWTFDPAVAIMDAALKATEKSGGISPGLYRARPRSQLEGALPWEAKPASTIVSSG